jgi:hypothetical protein
MKKEQIEFEIARLQEALEDFRKHSMAYPILARHGFMERTACGFKAIDPEAVQRRCCQLINQLQDQL